MSEFSPPLLGRDNAVRFSSPEHFLLEYRENLSKGRLFVRDEGGPRQPSSIEVAIDGPGVGTRITVLGRIRLVRDGYLGIEVVDFDDKLRVELEALANDVTRQSATFVRSAPVRNEVTEVDLQPPSSHDASEQGPPSETLRTSSFVGVVLAPDADGIVRVSGPVSLFGLYTLLSEGAQIHVSGIHVDPSASEWVVRLRIGNDAHIALRTQVVGRDASGIRVRWPDLKPIASYLASHARLWREPMEALLPSSANDASTQPNKNASVGTPSSPPEMETAHPDGGHEPTPGTLIGNVVHFHSTKDLRHEIDTNLKNGGLFVLCGPLPLRSHHTLGIAIESRDTGVRLETDVVFAADGRVGFSVADFGAAVLALEQAMSQEGTSPRTTSLPPAQSASAAGASSASPRTEVPMGAPSFAISSKDVRPAHASVPPASAQARAAMRPTVSIPPNAAFGKPDATPSLAHGASGRFGPAFAIHDLLDLPRMRTDASTSVAGASTLVLIDHLARHRATGVLEIARDAEHKTLYIHEGSIAYIEASPVVEEHWLGRMLMQSKKINESALKDAIERARAARRPLGRTLVSLGHINASALLSTLRDQTRAKLIPAFSWSSGTFVWHPWRDPPTSADLVLVNGLGVVSRHLRQAFEHTTVSDVESCLGSAVGEVVVRAEDADLESPVIGLEAKELRFIEMAFDGKKTLAEALTGSALGRLSSLRLVGFGLGLGFLRFRDLSARPHATGSLNDRKSDVPATTRHSVMEELKRLRSQNHFEALGVHWSAHQRTYPLAYSKAKARFDAEKGELKGASADVLALAREAIAIIDSAYAVLMNESERIQYRKRLFDATEREYSAEMLVRQGEVLMMRGDRIAGIEAFETAVELAPSAKNRALLVQAREGKNM